MPETRTKVELAYEESLLAVSDQNKSLERVRTRAAGGIASAAAVAGLLGFSGSGGGWSFWIGLGGFLGVVGALGYVSVPVSTWYQNPAFNAVKTHIDEPAFTRDDMLRDLALYHQIDWGRNRARLNRMHSAMSVGILAFAVMVVFLLVDRVASNESPVPTRVVIVEDAATEEG